MHKMRVDIEYADGKALEMALDSIKFMLLQRRLPLPIESNTPFRAITENRILGYSVTCQKKKDKKDKKENSNGRSENMRSEE